MSICVRRFNMHSVCTSAAKRKKNAIVRTGNKFVRIKLELFLSLSLSLSLSLYMYCTYTTLNFCVLFRSNNISLPLRYVLNTLASDSIRENFRYSFEWKNDRRWTKVLSRAPGGHARLIGTLANFALSRVTNYYRRSFVSLSLFR